MKTLIGITQHLEETEEYLSKEFKISGAKTEVGPFRSSEDASQWMQFMMTRSEGYEPVTLPVQPSADSIWYGFTFERLEPQIH